MSQNVEHNAWYESIPHEPDNEVVHAFYGKVQNDPHIGYIFNDRIDDWPYPLSRMVNFWSGILFGARNYTLHPRGTPPILHMAISELEVEQDRRGAPRMKDRKSTRLNSSHVAISYAVFCLKKKDTAR